MMNIFRETIKGVVVAGVMLLGAGQGVWAESLYEYYTTASADTLRTETSEMGKELTQTFDQKAISSRQKRIDFAEYFANLKKLIIYAGRLAAYSEYGKDLQFARDNEIFKGLPKEAPAADQGKPRADRKDFVNRKYGEMKKNVEEEIDTYEDLLILSLEACETLIQNDLNGFADHAAYQKRVEDFKQSTNFRDYRERRTRLAKGWPDLAARVARQFALWDPRPASPDDPIIDVKIAGAI